ncbi:ras-related protein Rab-1B-like [Mytilus trossulus]|uniref:ras-related protein Rab-1B-like n=1 Tax=Mytilus trossulus TaxID=6551 RepID=UPI003006E7DB
MAFHNKRKKSNKLSILVAGSSGCGKTSLVNRFVGDTFTEEHIPTQRIGAKSHTVEVNGKEIRLQLTDTDGDRKYEGYSINYYEEMDATIIVYDISKQESLETASDILKRWRTYTFGIAKAFAFLVGNKSDMEREINKVDVENFAEKENLLHTETSAKTNENVTEMFMSLIKRLANDGDVGGGNKPADDSPPGGSNKQADETTSELNVDASKTVHADTAPSTTTQNSNCCVIC